MKRERYMFGTRGEQYGIWNTVKKCWQFGICEDTPMLAEARLFQKIGDNARKFRFEARALPKEMRRATPEPQLVIELQRKDREIKLLKHSQRHGHWVKLAPNCDMNYCSICGDGHPWVSNFCPYCGAKMDEEV